MRAAAAEWWRQRDGGGDKASGWKSPRDGSCSPSREPSRASLMRLCLLDKHLFDNLMHGRATPREPDLHTLITSGQAELSPNTCWDDYRLLCASVLCLSPHMWAESRDAGDESSGDIASPHLSLITCFLFLSGPTRQIWYFGRHLALLSPAVPKLPSSFLLAKSLISRTVMEPFFWLLTNTHIVLADSYSFKWKGCLRLSALLTKVVHLCL